MRPEKPQGDSLSCMVKKHFRFPAESSVQLFPADAAFFTVCKRFDFSFQQNGASFFVSCIHNIIGSDIRLHAFSEKLRVLLALGKTFRNDIKSVQTAEVFGTYQKVALGIDRIEKIVDTLRE